MTVVLTVEELHRLLDLQRLETLRDIGGRAPKRKRSGRSHSESLGIAARASTDLADLVRRAWPVGIELVEHPELTSGNVRRYLIRRVLGGEVVVSTADVAMRFFGRTLSPLNSHDGPDLRRLWYCIREAKREIERTVGGHWEDATDAPVRAGSTRSWRFVPQVVEALGAETLAYREHA